MSGGPAREILPGTEIAATALSKTPIRVYCQDPSGGVREFSYSSGWTDGTEYAVRFQVKSQSPMAVKEWFENDHRHIRIYALDKQNKIHEQGWDGSSWSKGSLRHPAPSFSKLAAIVLDKEPRVYYQSWDGSEIRGLITGRGIWVLFSKLTSSHFKHYRGTSIAAVGWSSGNIRVYVQSDDNHICEYKSGIGSQLDTTAKRFSPLAAITWSDTTSRKIRIYSLDRDDYIQEYSYDEGTGWFVGSLTTKKIQAAPHSKLSAIHWDKSIRIYYQSPYNDLIEEYCTDLDGTDWYQSSSSLAPTPRSYSAIDTSGATYPVGWMPSIIDLASFHKYDPATIDGVGVLIGCINGQFIGEDLKSKKSTALQPNTDGNSYAWVYTPEGAIFYRQWQHDHRPDYVRHWQFGSWRPVMCAGEFRLAREGYLDTVLIMTNDTSGHYMPKGSECLGPVATKLENLGILLDQTTWYYNA